MILFDITIIKLPNDLTAFVEGMRIRSWRSLSSTAPPQAGEIAEIRAAGDPKRLFLRFAHYITLL